RPWRSSAPRTRCAPTRTPRAATWRSSCPLTGSRWTSGLRSRAAAAEPLSLLFAERCNSLRVVDDRRARGRGMKPAREQRGAAQHGRLLHQHPVAGPDHHEARPVAHVVGAAALLHTRPPPALLRAAPAVVVHEQA